jgi:galactokinase
MPDVRERSQFVRLFGDDPDATASAPGRVNLIGEHTDYHQGFVLPMPVPQRTVVRVRRRNDCTVRASSASMRPENGAYVLGKEARGLGWVDYVQGVTAALARGGRALTGFDVLIESTVPPGGGVSSSAALSVALLRALRTLNRFDLGDVDIACLAQKAETDFVGAPIGIMDQMACSVGRPDEALFLDTRTLSFERLAWPTTIDLMVINSGVSHAHAGGEYTARRNESFSAAALLGVSWLRDTSPAAVARAAMPDKLRRRARHIVTENQRVLEAVKAVRSGDGLRLGTIFNESHASLRDDYQVSVAEVDTLVSLGQSDRDVYGARLTGGGFGGAVVMVAASGTAHAASQRIVEAYRKSTGLCGSILIPEHQSSSALVRSQSCA